MKSNDYRLGYRGDIEGLRAVAILLVIAAHAGVPWLAGGFIGVDVFFVLSGFLITGLLLREMADTGQIDFACFYLRRLRRLMPALILMIVLISLSAYLLLGPEEQLPQANKASLAALWLSNVSFALTQTDYFAPSAENSLFLHTWSLGVEEQFYLVWPALLLWSLGRGHRELPLQRLKSIMLGIFAISLGVCVLATPRSPQFAFYMMPVRAWEFAGGALIWLFSGKMRAGEVAREKGAVFTRWLGWTGMVMIIGTAASYGTQMSYPGWHAVLPVAGTMAVIAAGWADDTHSVSRLLSYRWMQAVGRVSYSWYLWHWPVLVLGHALNWSHDPSGRLVAVLLSLGLAMASYRFVETPIRQQDFWLSHRRTAMYGTLGITVAVCLVSMHWFNVAAAYSESPIMQRYSHARFDAPSIYSRGCDDWYYSDRVMLCSYGPSDAAHTLVLMGDSIAGQWFSALLPLATKPGWRLVVATKSSCPMVDEPYFYARIGREYTECASWRHQAVDQVASLHPDVVVLSMGLGGTQSFSQTQWIEGTARSLSALSGQAGRVYLLRTTPHLDFDGPSCLASRAGRPKWLGSAAGCESVVDDARERQVYQWLQQAAARFPNVQIVDMNGMICPELRCSAERNGQVVFRDAQHLTASFATSLGPALSARLGL
ncbi:Peptidoglycan/LPS O-acetylase OafA/YrhL, contains acyltransferase and SGNH-hydrolase domains [Dyella jiangningensis]|uniref:acyltransferase family protein n=1 Tax=Dyella sp. AtDHG13 TaxID=1938897 RepID=UPI00088EF825|nr:acyltransferase family protein [Dyella sp. AtDHG13]PXV58212.1 peptidoglycan/LPS O-acetylase OafA/YrhL [Dyella sp. AtDHG13]SDK11712.1 Peptidoglycan/LPS O-acetylase OafA/YrhL, contains acyltransferase and SGNH-hydrolase domains [Dyella jiangningensis]